MALSRTYSSAAAYSILALMLVAIVTSGIPLVAVHSHDNANFGHSHNADEFFDGHVNHGESAGHQSDSDSAGENHAHKIGAPVLSPVEITDMVAVVVWNEHGQAVPPQTRPPDNVITPLYRPPIV